jgi:hypothetical protein
VNIADELRRCYAEHHDVPGLVLDLVDAHLHRQVHQSASQARKAGGQVRSRIRTP